MCDAVGTGRLVEKYRQQRIAWSAGKAGYIIFAKLSLQKLFERI